MSIYEIVALETPKVIRNCSKCKKSSEFYCSEKFRVNANQKIVDIWLIYNCAQCEGTWNFPILSRVHVSKMDASLHQRFMSNDRETIWYYAFQCNQLRKLCNDVNTNIRYELRKEEHVLFSEDTTISLRCKYDFGLRIDKLLAEILKVSRSKVNNLAQEGKLLLTPIDSIKNKVIDDLQITVKGIGLK